MDAADVFRQGLVSVPPRQPQQTQYYFPGRQPPPQIPQYPFLPYSSHTAHTAGRPQPARHNGRAREDVSNKDAGSDIKYILTACCRCRMKKMGCDPGLPKCTRCARAGATCEYFDATKGKIVPRKYVVILQEKACQLKAEVAQFVRDDDDDGENLKSNEEIVSPGGMVRVGSETEGKTFRYVGPSSGVAVVRLVLEEVNKHCRISQLMPEVRARRTGNMDRMNSIVNFRQSLAGPSSTRKKSYPMTSELPAETLPTRVIADRLVEVYKQRAQVFAPTLHEKLLLEDVDAVFNGDSDPYKNFVVRMVLAISLQKLDEQYAGLADSYYLAAMQHFEAVVRPKDLRTLQCLVLIGQYSLLTPTETATYFVVGLATRICQQLGLGEEKTVRAGYDMGLVDPLTLDMRRRLAWIITTNEFGLAQSMGRPSGFAKSDDLMDVGFFSTADDEDITKEGIKQGEPCAKKLVSIHFCKMRILQAEIRRVLYERSLPEKPKHENHPWFAQMQEKIKSWLDSSPPKPEWCKPWFTGRYHTMIITLFRPSPQVPKPTARAALRCYASAAYIITLSSQQVMKAAIDITWVFVLTLYMAFNTTLWTISYPEVREAHGKDEVEELLHNALDLIMQCSERWPTTVSASRLAKISEACMHAYDKKEDQPKEHQPTSDGLFSTPSFGISNYNSQSALDDLVPPTVPGGLHFQRPQEQPHYHQPAPVFNPPQFGMVFNSTPDQMKVEYDFDLNRRPNTQPAFRNNSIFAAPASDSRGRKFSYFPPDFTETAGRRGSCFPPESNFLGQPQSSQTPMSDQSEEPTPPATGTPSYNTMSSPPFQPTFSDHASPPIPSGAHSLPSPPESLAAPSMHSGHKGRLSPMSARGTTSPAQTMSNSNSPAPPLSAQHSPMVPALRQETSDFQNYRLFSPQDNEQNRTMAGNSTMAGSSRHPPFSNPSQAHVKRRSPPQTMVTDVYNPPPPSASTYYLSQGDAWNTHAPGPTSAPGFSNNSGLGIDFGAGPGSHNMANILNYDLAEMFGAVQDTGMTGMHYTFPHNTERQGSLSSQQQMELMDALETDGLSEIDAFLQAPVGLTGMEGIRWGG